MIGDPCPKWFEPLGELGKRMEKDRKGRNPKGTQLPEYSLTGRDRLNGREGRNVHLEGAIMGFSPTKVSIPVVRKTGRLH